MKINGFVNLKTSYIWDNACAAIVRIENKRIERKQEIIDNKRNEMLKKNWYQRLFNIQKDFPTDEQVWARLDYEAANDFFGTCPQYWVNSYYAEYEKQLNEIMSASKDVDEMLVSSKLAARLSRGDDF